MNVYRYRGILNDGRATEGRLAAVSRAALHRALATQEITVIDVKEVRRHTGGWFRRRVRRDDLIEFSQSMASLLSAGIPVLQALDDLADQAESRRWRGLLKDLHLRVSGGASVSEALKDHPDVFEDLFVSLVSAGEESGRLDHGFQKFMEYLEWTKSTHEQLRRAIAYPVLVLSAVGADPAAHVLRLSAPHGRLREPRRGAAPTHAHHARCRPLRSRLVAGRRRAPRHRRRRAALRGANALGTPPLRHVSTSDARHGSADAIVRARSFRHDDGDAARCGIPLERALTLVESGIGNQVMADSIRRARHGICGGETLSEALTKAGRFTRKLVRVISVGESTGNLVGMFQLLGTQYEREMPGAIWKVTSVIGPAALIILAATVGTAAMGVFLPLLRLSSAIK